MNILNVCIHVVINEYIFEIRVVRRPWFNQLAIAYCMYTTDGWRWERRESISLANLGLVVTKGYFQNYNFGCADIRWSCYCPTRLWEM